MNRNATALNAAKEKRLLRKAAYWLRDYASLFTGSDLPNEPGVRRHREKLLKLATQCRKAGRVVPVIETAKGD